MSDFFYGIKSILKVMVKMWPILILYYICFLVVCSKIPAAEIDGDAAFVMHFMNGIVAGLLTFVIVFIVGRITDYGRNRKILDKEDAILAKRGTDS